LGDDFRFTKKIGHYKGYPKSIKGYTLMITPEQFNELIWAIRGIGIMIFFIGGMIFLAIVIKK